MPLIKTTLVQAIKAALDAVETEAKKGSEDTDAVKQQYADEIADAIDVYIKSATVTGAFTGTSSAGPVTGTLTGGTIT